MSTVTLPLPPLELRRLVGPTDPAAFDNPTGRPVFPYLEDTVYESVLDFGCGCGRVARMLAQQSPPVRHYLGVDVHRGMVEWCRRNLEPAAPNFRFVHHDVASPSFNPGPGKPDTLPFPVEDASVTLLQACSIFTHLVEPVAEHYLRECARVLRADGAVNATWFLFDKSAYPMMQEFQNALYINHIDPINAVIFDLNWLRRRVTEAGLVITQVVPPEVRGFQWTTVLRPARPGARHVEFPPDLADEGLRRPPLLPFHPDLLGLTD